MNDKIYLARLLRKYIKDFEKEVFFVCVGTDKNTGDALGPMVGTLLKKEGFTNVMGTLLNPVHAKNIHETVKIVNKEHKDKVIVAIDASITRDINHVGLIDIRKEPLSPGTGIGKNLPQIGDIRIAGIINSCRKGDEFFVLNNTRLGKVYDLAIQIVDIISLAVDKVGNKENASIEVAS